MTLTLKDLIKNGILNELAALFHNEDMANILLDLIDFPVALRPDNDRTLGYWREICNQIQSGAMQGGTDLQPLIDAALELYPANPTFQQYCSDRTEENPDNSQQPSSSSSETQQTNNLSNFSPATYSNNPSSQNSSNTQNKLQVFLCHSSGDKTAVRKLYQQLKNDGFQPWLDEENLLPGQDWELEIEKAVESADIILVCLSQSSVTKVGYVQKEIKFALDIADRQPEGSIFIIPVKLQDCQIPRRLSNKQWVDLYTDAVKGYSRLVTALEH